MTTTTRRTEAIADALGGFIASKTAGENWTPYGLARDILARLVPAEMLAAEHLTTVERIRAALDSRLNEYHYHGSWADHFRAILDEEAAR